tara:strand:- start:305 stop:448 length:144 start_codon:yes stop_codon:yes gene_type:complete
MINQKEKLKIMSIINMCNAIKRDDLKKKKDSDFWILKIKDMCGELLK